MKARVVWVLMAVCAATSAHAAVPEPDGFRLDHYRDPVPKTLHGARVVTTTELQTLLAAQHPLLIDVLPSPRPPEDARPALPRLPLPHRDIPGSLWLPDFGRGALTPETESRFRTLLLAAAGGQRRRPIVFYCLSQCWMSWNAAKRALLWGYANAIWYPDGADGWEKAGNPTQIATPAT